MISEPDSGTPVVLPPLTKLRNFVVFRNLSVDILLITDLEQPIVRRVSGTLSN